MSPLGQVFSMNKTGERSVWPRTSSAKVIWQKSTKRHGNRLGRVGVHHSIAGAEARARCHPDPFELDSDGDLNTFLLIHLLHPAPLVDKYSPWSNFFNIWNKIEKFILSRSGQIGCFHHWDNLKLLEFWAGTGGPGIGFWGPLKERGRGQRASVRSARAALSVSELGEKTSGHREPNSKFNCCHPSEVTKGNWSLMTESLSPSSCPEAL